MRPKTSSASQIMASNFAITGSRRRSNLKEEEAPSVSAMKTYQLVSGVGGDSAGLSERTL